MPKGFAVFLVAGVLFSMARPAFADKTPDAALCDAAESENYLTKASGQLLRGTTNLCFCWVELFNQPVVAYREGRGVFGGILPAFGHTLKRGAEGLGELLLFAAPRTEKTGAYPKFADDCALGVVGLEAR